MITIALVLVTATALVYPTHQIYLGMIVAPIGATISLFFIRINLAGAPPGLSLYYPSFLKLVSDTLFVGADIGNCHLYQPYYFSLNQASSL